MIPQRSFWRRSWPMLVCLVLIASLLSPALERPTTVRAQSTNGPWIYDPAELHLGDISGSVNWYARYEPYLSTPTRGCFKLVVTPPAPAPGYPQHPSTLYAASTITNGVADPDFSFFTDYSRYPEWEDLIHITSGLFTHSLTDGAGADWDFVVMKAGTTMTITRVGSIPNRPQHTCTEGFTGADLATQLSVSRSTQPVGGRFTTTVHVGNQGSSTASNVRTTLTLGSGLAIDAATPSVGTYSGGVWSISSLTSGQQATLTLTTRVASGALGTLLNMNASASSSTTDLNTTNNAKQYSVMIGAPSAPSGAPKAGDPCPRGSRSRSFTGQIDAEGQPVNTFWQRFWRRPVAQVTLTWGGLCFNGDGSINTTLTTAANYSVSIAPRNGWAATRITSSPNCAITASQARCEHRVRLTPPASERLNVSFDIGGFLHEFGTRFGLSYSGTSSTSAAEVPVGMLIFPRGDTYAAGAGSQPLPGSVGNY